VLPSRGRGHWSNHHFCRPHPWRSAAAARAAECGTLALIAQATVGGIILVALVAAFLPVPMAFDVAIANIVMTKGVPPYGVTILCTLGIVSVFSLSVVGKTISWKIAAAACATVAAVGALAGLLTRTRS
jgi:hypothetical protein